MTTKKYLVLQEQIDTTDNMPISKGAATTALSGKVDKNGTDRLMTAAEGTKLGGIETGAQVNILEGIQFNGTDATITSKKVNITPALIGAATTSHTHGNADLQTGIDAAKIASVSGSKLPMEVIPKAAVFDLVIVANKAARLALTEDDVQKGDVVKENDTGLMYFVVDVEKLGTEAAFEAFKAGEASSVEWANVKNKVNASSTADGILKASDWVAFNGKQNAITSGSPLSADLVSETSTKKFVSPTEKSTWSGKQDAITSSNKLGADLVDDTSATHKFVTASEKTAWNTHVADTGIHVTTSDKSAWNAKQSAIPAGTSGNVVTYSGTAGTVGSLGFDTAPTASSQNLVKSGAIATALAGKANVTGVVGIGKDTTGYYIEE